MLQYRKIKFSDEIDINKLNKSKECIIFHYWYFKDISYELEPFVCNKCHDISIMAYELENIAVLNLKGVDYRCALWNITRNDAIIMNTDFGRNKTPVEIIKEGKFGETYF